MTTIFHSAIDRLKVQAERQDPPDKYVEVPDGLWSSLLPLLPPLPKPSKEGGRPPVEERIIVAAVIQRLKTGCTWKSFGRHYKSGSTVHLRYERWIEAGSAQAILKTIIKYFGRQNLKGLDIEWGEGINLAQKSN